MFYIVGSAGHDMNTPGKRTHRFSDGSFMKEYEHNRPVFDELMKLLNDDDRFTVLDTAPRHTFVSLNERTSIANRFQEKHRIPRDKILYVSVHANADSSKTWSSARGCETLYYPGSLEGEKFAKAIGIQISEALGVPNRGIKPRKDLAITRRTTMPAVITEAAFMTNKIEAMKLMDSEIRLKEARAIYKGICEGFGIQHKLEKAVQVTYDENQKDEIMISFNKPFSYEEVVEKLHSLKIKKTYAIKEIQSLLKGAGYYDRDIDGSKGPLTKKAILMFQRKHQLEEKEGLDFKAIMILRKENI